MPHDVEQLLMSGLFYIDEVPFREMIHAGIQEGMPVGFTAVDGTDPANRSCSIFFPLPGAGSKIAKR